jgi:transposase
MLGPGEYKPDHSARILTPEEVPPAKVVRRSRTYRQQVCPRCGKRCGRDRVFTRVLHAVGDLVSARPRDIHLVYAQYHCVRCRKYFTADMSDYAVPKAQYTHRVVSLAVRLVVEDGLPYQAASWHLWRDHRVFVPFATIQNWVAAGGEKGRAANVDALSRLGPGGLLRLHRGR